MGVKLTQEEFIAECNEKHSSYYDYSKVVYKNNKEKITIICPIHGVFKQVQVMGVKFIK
jgi:protein tyrosine phosphatase